MQLEAGARIASYEIVAPLGAGGMGEVYRARDARLGREVAIKLLPPGVTTNADRLQRFEQEARAAGMLNHPNLLTVFELGMHDGAPYIVTELLEGETLRARLEGGAALAPRKAIEIAVQIANGLAAAHEKGIVHRDLKPDNLFLTRDGRVKILDFGLAKLINAPATPQESTMKMQHTAPGTVMGTAGYMAPEQVRGDEVDHRTDIFAFGAILYEMLAGRRAFARNSSVETMNAILKDDPPELSASGRIIPPALQKIVDHCLEKNPAARFQSAKDVAFHLETITSTESGAARSLGRAPRARSGAILTAAAIAFALIAAGAAWIAIRRAKPEQPSIHQLTYRRGTVRSARFAPDGQTVVFGAAWDGGPIRMFQTRINELESAAVPLPDGDVLSIAPSGEMAISLGRRFEAWTSYGTLATASLLGGASRPLLEHVNCADYSPDGKEMAVVRRAGNTDVLEWPLGKKLLDTRGYFSHVRIAPDGERVAFLDHPFFGDNRGDVVVIDRSGKKSVLVRDWSSVEGMAWSADGSEVWFTGDRDGSVGVIELYGVDLKGKLRNVWYVPTNLTLLDISRGGRVLVTSGGLSGSIYGMRPSDVHERDLTFLTWANADALSPRGDAIVATSYGAGAGQYYSTYLRQFDGTYERLGEGQAQGISPDGKWVAAVRLSDPPKLLLHPVGAGTTRVIDTKGFRLMHADWLPDGRLGIAAPQAGGGTQFAIVDPASGDVQPITISGSDTLAVGGFAATPDGKSFFVRKLGTSEIVLLPLSGGAPRPSAIVLKSDDDAMAGWAADGQLYVAHPDPPLFHIDKCDLVSGACAHVRDVPMPDPIGSLGHPHVMVTPDAKTYVTSATRILNDLFVVEGLR